MTRFMTRPLFFFSLLFGSIALLPAAARADVPGPHPAYLHALSDLRMARAYLSEGWGWDAVRGEDERAIQEIDAAIREIKHAAINDGKDVRDHEPIEAHLGWHDRFGRANDLLARAHHDLDHAEDVPESRGLRDRALMHIDEAHHTVDRAWHTAHWE
ncbi:MAG TPA: hypothetical protein VGG26_01130 [Terracidiphilus sp.]|jgi:hypothetical protein